jgi:hypothetical protein
MQAWRFDNAPCWTANTDCCVCCAAAPPAGPSTPTYSELWSVLVGNGNQFGVGTNPSSLTALNTQAAALRDELSSQSTGNNTLTIADALWTKGVTLNPAYAGDMQRLFKVRT